MLCNTMLVGIDNTFFRYTEKIGNLTKVCEGQNQQQKSPGLQPLVLATRLESINQHFIFSLS